jgi:2-dehydro-3-deoxygluconokinase
MTSADNPRAAPLLPPVTRPVARDVVTFGEALVLFLAEPGVPLSAATSFRRSVTGAELNFAVGISRLGHRAGWFGRVGDDAHGRLIRRVLKSEDIDTSRIITDGEAPTGLITRDCHPGRPIDVCYARTGSAGSRLRPDDLDLGYLSDCRVLGVTGVTAAISPTAFAAALRAVQAAREAGVTVLFDPNIRHKLGPLDVQVDRMRQLCQAADIVLAGEDEAMAISGRSDPAGLGDWFLGRGARLAVLKRGEQGAWASDGTEVWQQPAFAVTVADPVGAGDAFAAGFVSAALRGAPVGQALKEAAAVGALDVAVAGDIEGLPTAEERDRFLAGSGIVRR